MKMVIKAMIPAAQYLRMSTEHQQYSLENQGAAIHDYAQKMGFNVVRTYSDASRSGLSLKRRDGLRQLLNDIVNGTLEFKAILVHDVSRWGRFQDADEAAHYEFLCKTAGIEVHYCAELFPNDDSFTSSIMKTLKRVMAAEYSRELSAKVHDGEKRVAEAGFRTGGTPGYGLQRMLVSANRERKCILFMGERKSNQTDRVILVPGPLEEVRCVQEIFRMFVQEGKGLTAIANKLQSDGVVYRGCRKSTWYPEAVKRILKNPKYCGCSVFGQSKSILQGVRSSNPRDSWTITPGAWQALVDQETFERTQERFADQTIHKTDDALLLRLRRLLERHGALSAELFNQAQDLPSIGPYARRFGSLSEAFEKVGYIGPRLATTKARRKVRVLREQVINQVIALDPRQITRRQRNGHWRASLCVSSVPVSVHMCRCFRGPDGNTRWILNPVLRERDWIALLILLQLGNENVLDLFILPNTRGQVRYTFSMDDALLGSGCRLNSISEFFFGIDQVQQKIRATSQKCGIQQLPASSQRALQKPQ